MFPTKDTVNVGRLAIETGAVVLYEIEEGIFSLTGRSKTLAHRNELKPLSEYLSVQGRFKGLPEKVLADLQARVRENWEGYRKRAQDAAGPAQ